MSLLTNYPFKYPPPLAGENPPPPMAQHYYYYYYYFLCLCFGPLLLLDAHNLNTYIVQLHPSHPTPTEFENKHQWHLSFLNKAMVLEDLEEEKEEMYSRLLYSYSSAIEGFSALLSDDELASIRRLPGVVSVHPDRRFELQTTYSYKFLGLDFLRNGVWLNSKFGGGAVVGVLDTGVWPESPSFSDHGMPPVPRKWRGICQEGEMFNSSSCNRKLIGARFYSRGHRSRSELVPSSALEYISPRDAHGHGTHTSSTAAGATVRRASVLGVGTGDARGIAPGAHVAVYKVCWFNGCYSSDILAGMDDAITDGVDILSLSIGGFPLPLPDDNIAIGAFRATEHGILVVCAAGNNGPIPSSVVNEAPWITTVGASMMDRRFPTFVRTGDGKVLYGESMFPGKPFSVKSSSHGGGGRGVEIVYNNGSTGRLGAEFCLRGSLVRDVVKGKIVVCDRGTNGRAEKGQVVKEAGGVGMVLANTAVNLEEDSVDVHVLPATAIGYRESIQLKHYMRTTKNPTARIEFGGTRLHHSRAPSVALFSARGPSLIVPSVLKPDVIAPGVNIIAAWPQNLGPSGLEQDTRRTDFTVLSGTSMACPHVTGLAALVRSAHPSWTPAMIKSAIMTTTDVVDNYGKPIMDGDRPATLLATGSGHINPRKALDPGLVYDISPEDYVTHLCSLGYSTSEILAITHRNLSTTRCEKMKMSATFSLNYPSISVIFRKGEGKVVMVERTVMNVGVPKSTYSVRVSIPNGVSVRVVPKKLTFGDVGESKKYRVWFWTRKTGFIMNGRFEEGHVTWVHEKEKKYRVRSPVSVSWV